MPVCFSNFGDGVGADEIGPVVDEEPLLLGGGDACAPATSADQQSQQQYSAARNRLNLIELVYHRSMPRALRRPACDIHSEQIDCVISSRRPRIAFAGRSQRWPRVARLRPRRRAPRRRSRAPAIWAFRSTALPDRSMPLPTWPASRSVTPR